MIGKITRAFSLLELTVAVAITVSLFVLTQAQLHKGGQSAGSHGLALELAAQIRACRQQAMASGQTYAMSFPNTLGTPLSQSVYLRRGFSQGTVYAVSNYSSEYPGQVLFTGSWPLASGYGSNSNGALAYSKQGSVQVANWLGSTSDPTLVFTPDGSVLSNGMVSFAGAYHMVVAAGMAVRETTVSPAATSLHYFKPTSVGSCWTVSCSGNGAVRVDQGLLGQSGSIPISETVASTATAPAPSLPASSAGSALITDIFVGPQRPISGTTTTACVVAPGEAVSLSVNATSSDGQPLSILWSSASGGPFSQPAETRMIWDPSNQVWSSTWQWMPPNSTPGSTFTLSCQVRNASGTVAALSSTLPAGATSPQVSLAGPGQICFTNGSGQLSLMDSQGGGLHTLSPTNFTTYASSPPCYYALLTDPNRFCYSDASNNIYIADTKAGQILQMIVGVGSYPALSPDGTRLAYIQTPAAGGLNYYVESPPGATATRLLALSVPASLYQGGNGSDQFSGISWSPTSDRFVIEHLHNDTVAVSQTIWTTVVNATPTSPPTQDIFYWQRGATIIPGQPMSIGTPWGPPIWSPDVNNTTAPIVIPFKTPTTDASNVYALAAIPPASPPHPVSLQDPVLLTSIAVSCNIGCAAVASNFATFNRVMIMDDVTGSQQMHYFDVTDPPSLSMPYQMTSVGVWSTSTPTGWSAQTLSTTQ